MNIYKTIPDIGEKTAVALGYFDGLHAGHRSVIKAAVEYAKANEAHSALFTFETPSSGGVKGKEIFNSAEKQYRAAEIGVENYICPLFSEMKNLSCGEFVNKILAKSLKAKALFCGADYTFGANKAGNTDTLKRLCEPLGIKVTVLPMLEYDGFGISSTRIRKALANGDIKAVNTMLCAPYAVILPIVHGQGLGRKIGVPTINQLYSENMQMPKSGVYATRVSINGKAYAGATGLGSRPTVNGEGISCETYIASYSGTLYGESIRVEFLEYLRETEKFSSLDELRDCILSAAAKSAKINFKAEGKA